MNEGDVCVPGIARLFVIKHRQNRSGTSYRYDILPALLDSLGSSDLPIVVGRFAVDQHVARRVGGHAYIEVELLLQFDNRCYKKSLKVMFTCLREQYQ